MARKYIRYAALVVASVACMVEVSAMPRHEQEAQDYIVIDDAANIVQLTTIGAGPNPSLASQAAKTQLHFRCMALRGQLIGFPTITVHGSGSSYSAIAFQNCLVSD